MSQPVVAFTTLPADFDATPLAQELVGSGLAACVNIIPGVISVYTWKGVPQVSKEQQVIMKTTAGMAGALWEVLKPRHPYDLPEFVVLPIADGSGDYVQWIEDSVGPQRES
jgi:periplasmic divalent cation tolerance protein